MTHRVEFSPAAARQIRKLPRVVQHRLRLATDGLAVDPRPAGARSLQGDSGRLRIRVGDYRVIYTVADDVVLVLVLSVGHRREVYRQR